MKFDDKTLVLGVGSQKAGTTWLHSYLSERGDIFMPKRKEMHYFDAKYRPELVGPRRKRLLKEWGAADTASDGGSDPDPLHDDFVYKEYFRKRVPAHINFYGEITPTYAFIGELGYGKIRDLFPSIRIIFIMRDPIERFYSQVRMFRNKRIAKAKPQRELDFLVEHRRFLELSAYENTVRALDAVFGRDEVIYLFYETLFRVETIKALCTSLGVTYRPGNFDLIVNSGGSYDDIPAATHEQLLGKFEATYRFCRDRFPGELPPQWHNTGDTSQVRQSD